MILETTEIKRVFHNNINRFMYFSQKRQVHRFLCRISTHNYVYLITLLILEEEHNQLYRHPSVEFLVRSIHFVHFIHSYMYPLLPMTISYHLFRLLIGSSGSFLTPIPVSDWSIFCCGNSIIHQKRTKSDKNTYFLIKKENAMKVHVLL